MFIFLEKHFYYVSHKNFLSKLHWILFLWFVTCCLQWLLGKTSFFFLVVIKYLQNVELVTYIIERMNVTRMINVYIPKKLVVRIVREKTVIVFVVTNCLIQVNSRLWFIWNLTITYKLKRCYLYLLSVVHVIKWSGKTCKILKIQI